MARGAGKGNNMENLKVLLDALHVDYYVQPVSGSAKTVVFVLVMSVLIAIAFISAFIGIFKGGRAWLTWFAVSIVLVAVGAPLSQAILPKEVVVAHDLNDSAVVTIIQAGYKVEPLVDRPGMYEISLR